jgi:myosin-1
MQVIGLSDGEQNSIFKVLAAILWLGNVEFVDNGEGNAAIADTGVTDFAAYLMEVDTQQLQKVLQSRIMETTRGGRRGKPRFLSSEVSKQRADGQDPYTRYLSMSPKRHLVETPSRKPYTTTYSTGLSVESMSR